MAMITCPECGKSISDRALKCPACGYPIKKVSEKKGKQQINIKFSKNAVIIVSCILLFVIFSIIVISLFSPKSVFIHEESIQLTIGDIYDLNYDIIPDRAIKANTTVKSSDENIVSIKGNTLSAKNEGKCQIQITTWNGKTSQCKVEVISEKDNQKNHIGLVSDYIKNNADQTGDNNTSIKQIYSLEDNEVFMIARSDDGICLMFQKNNSYGNDLTMVLLKSGDLREAYLSDVSTFVFDGETMSTSAKGKFLIAKYNYGDKVDISDVSSENTPSDFEVGITDESQKRIDKGVENAIKYFKQFLSENPNFGELSDYGFKMSE